MFKNLFVDEHGNGAETVEIVIGIICSVGLGAALLSFQSILRGAIQDTGSSISTLFGSLAAGATSDLAGSSIVNK